MPSFDLNGPDEGIADALRSIGIDEWIIECETGTIVDPPNLTADQLAAIEAHREANIPWNRVRARRNNCLQDTDWTQGADVPDSIKTPMAEYRAKLRSITTDQSDPFNITWPTRPSV